MEFILEKLKEKKQVYKNLLIRYGGYNSVKYPGQAVLNKAVAIIDHILMKQTDNIALVDALLAVQDDLEDIIDALDDVEQFFESQSGLFEEAFYFESNMMRDREYLQEKPETIELLNKIRAILQVPEGRDFDYTRIPQLRRLIDQVRAAHNELLEDVRQSNYEVINQCMNSIHEASGRAEYVREQIDLANTYYLNQRKHIQQTGTIIELKGVTQSLFEHQSKAVSSITSTIHAHEEKLKPQPVIADKVIPATIPASNPVIKPLKIKKMYKQTFFQSATLRNKEDIDCYLQHVRQQLESQLKTVDEIRLS